MTVGNASVSCAGIDSENTESCATGTASSTLYELIAGIQTGLVEQRKDSERKLNEQKRTFDVMISEQRQRNLIQEQRSRVLKLESEQLDRDHDSIRKEIELNKIRWINHDIQQLVHDLEESLCRKHESNCKLTQDHDVSRKMKLMNERFASTTVNSSMISQLKHSSNEVIHSSSDLLAIDGLKVYLKTRSWADNAIADFLQVLKEEEII
jgi:hypothetical protein